MKLLPCVLSALIVQQADAKRKKRGKQYLTVGQNPAAETEVCDLRIQLAVLVTVMLLTSLCW